MTGTAETEEGEFNEIYELDVVVIPTNRPIQRDDKEDLVFKTKREKFNAAIDTIREYHEKGNLFWWYYQRGCFGNHEPNVEASRNSAQRVKRKATRQRERNCEASGAARRRNGSNQHGWSWYRY